jgi:hypothetical protein
MHGATKINLQMFSQENMGEIRLQSSHANYNTLSSYTVHLSTFPSICYDAAYRYCLIIFIQKKLPQLTNELRITEHSTMEIIISSTVREMSTERHYWQAVRVCTQPSPPALSLGLSRALRLFVP